jgi:hypothetical protein
MHYTAKNSPSFPQVVHTPTEYLSHKQTEKADGNISVSVDLQKIFCPLSEFGPKCGPLSPDASFIYDVARWRMMGALHASEVIGFFGLGGRGRISLCPGSGTAKGRLKGDSRNGS